MSRADLWVCVVFAVSYAAVYRLIMLHERAQLRIARKIDAKRAALAAQGKE